MERHYALNWLFGMSPGKKWGEIPTDTPREQIAQNICDAIILPREPPWLTFSYSIIG